MFGVEESLPIAASFILAGIVVLLFGGDLLIRGAAALARRASLPPLLVGLTIVAFGTSAPELVVSIDAALSGAPGLALGNIVGSNIANVLFVLGLPALVGVIGTQSKGVRRNALFALAAGIALVIVSRDGTISTLEGGVLFALIIVFISLLAMSALKARDDDPLLAEVAELEEAASKGSMLTTLVSLVVGIILLPAGAHMIVTGGTSAAAILGVSDAVIGLTALAIGTSLPEFATVVVAVLRRQADLAIGNVLGSNVFNVFAVGGAAGLAAGAAGLDLPVPDQFMRFDFWVMLGASTLLAAWIYMGRNVGRLAGILFFGGYVAYIAALWVMNPIQF
ncbi:calcium/sodium antiporter [Hyphobacterium sp. HN65]|uniref:Calcium/sodium antiporter n=1 Tax=Hyphobacterium lacteum TaxID=3116575 RepID=A0ABU7LS57_9PROT|nr:calcium/sodium antiporter [Hyphobacterium sp. HN65]MEE2526419.1 calcium/sodium antiporter [Hyphobacterium sp. HN65]